MFPYSYTHGTAKCSFFDKTLNVNKSISKKKKKKRWQFHDSIFIFPFFTTLLYFKKQLLCISLHATEFLNSDLSRSKETFISLLLGEWVVFPFILNAHRILWAGNSAGFPTTSCTFWSIKTNENDWIKPQVPFGGF